MNYAQLVQLVQDYTQNTESTFVADIPTFVQQAEQRVFNSIQFPALRKNVTGVASYNNKYISAPSDFLAVYSFALIDQTTGIYNYLLDKDVNFMREAYPDPSIKGAPKYYGIFGPQTTLPNELTFIVGPTPDTNYNLELHYFFYPASIVQGIVTALGSVSASGSFTNGTYYNVALTGGSGTGATATVVVASNTVSSVTIANGGSFYKVGDSLTVPIASIGGTGVSCTATVTTVNNPDGTSWLGDNFDSVLLYGTLMEAYTFMKGEADMLSLYQGRYTEALGLAKRLGDGMERTDAYRTGQTRVPIP
jgi:hypothetical protein